MFNISYVWIFTFTIICPNLSSAEITVSPGSREVVDSAAATFTVSCQIGSLVGQVTTVEWKLGDIILSDDDTYTPNVGAASYNSGDGTNGTQTTTLEVAGSDTTRSNMLFTCVVTDPSDSNGATTKSANPELRFYTVTSTAKNVTTAVEQTLTCTIGGLDTNHAALVTWKDPEDAEVTDSTNYVLTPGTVDGSGNQNAVLTIKQAKMTTFAGKLSITYKCSVMSSQYSESPPSPDVEVVAAILKLAVTAVDKEQLTGTEAIIFCTVSGLTQVLDEVKWTLSDDTAIISGHNGHTIVTGEDSFSGDTQITTLAVTAAQNNIDTNYKCIISSTEHAETDKSTTVNLKVFTVTSAPKSVSTDTAQTLSCHIGGLDDSKGVSVTWKDPDGVQVQNTDTDNYVLDLGPVDGGNQNAELYIKQVKMETFARKSSLNYKCSVTSLQYSDSPPSDDQDVVLLIQAVQAVHKEQLEGTQAMVSCVVAGLTEGLDKVEWKTFDNTTITPADNGDGFYIDTGSLDNHGSQTTILIVPDSQTYEDKVYKCVITPNGDDVTEMTTEVNLKVFTISSTPKSVTIDTDQTLTCTIGGLDANQAVTVTWKDPNEANVLDSDTANYVLNPGTVDNDGNQDSMLTIKQIKIKEYAGDSSFTYKCSVTSSQYLDSPSSARQDVVANVEPHEKKKGIQTSAIIGAAIGGVLLVFGAAGFAFAIFKKTATKVAAVTIEVTYEGTAGTVHTNPHNLAGN